ncbi:nitroreductase family deazaflavin-dependent oxidoreductase [Gordonia polyisoprenivorans]|uniref:nitroreductase family deazaflavin-dependent oxidoreductase n=1 Tax=Gordonia polyisoprenivorans TaxID=84595 RepID=UPI001AD7CC54|nr:nitroreductase family deazaflavin-dependent oxidoreductase [Gordonia polyisoprenivorans]QTI69099.1 nitroreductase family deazaflavin-dependent oxidoreductase [Gordonia polyisoprenivorans]
MTDFNKTIIDEFHANDGTVTTMGFGRHLVLVHSIGAKSGAERVTPLMSLPDGAGGRFIVGSAAGSPKDPAWVRNLRKNPEITIEYAGEKSGIEKHPATATELDPPQREQAWQGFVAASEQFLKYTETAEGRVFPIFRLTPKK